MTTKTPRRADRATPARRPSAPPISAASASTSTRRLPFGDAGSVAGAAPRSASTRWSRTAASPAATKSRLRTQAVAPSLALGLGTHDARHRRRPVHCTRTTCPTTASPARRGPRARSRPAPRVAPNPVDQANYYGTPGVRLRRGLAGQRASAGRARRQPRRCSCGHSSATTRRTATAVISDDPEPGGLRPGDRARHGRAPGQRARERRSPRTRPASRRSRRDRADVARAHRHGRVHERVAVRADARRPRHAAAGRHLRARPSTRR